MRHRPALYATAALACVLAAPAAASASPTALVGIADENVLKGQTPGGAEKTVQEWKARGVQNVRMFARWDTLAPQNTATKEPEGFDGANPASYDFSALDRNLDLVEKNGMSVTLVVTGPGPVWGSLEPQRKNGTWKPNPSLFGEFASAVTKHVGSRVDRYIVWNEPNIPTWLQPQFTCRGTKCTPYSPGLYRQLADAGYTAIHANDPKATVAIGATSSFGDAYISRFNQKMQPLLFLREAACVTSKYKVKRSGSCKGFRKLKGDAYAYHPHPGSAKIKGRVPTPATKSPNRNDARMGDLGRLTGVLDTLQRKKRLTVGGGSRKMPLWFDEYGYQTNPPSSQGVAPRTAATYSAWGWSVAMRNPRVKLVTQYEWFDEGTGQEASGSGDGTTSRWQGGLFSAVGRAKPLNTVWDAPIFAWRNSRSAYVWGQVRPGEAKQRVTVQRRTGKAWRTYKKVSTNGNGVFQVKVARSSKAKFRFRYENPVTKAQHNSAAVAQRKQ